MDGHKPVLFLAIAALVLTTAVLAYPTDEVFLNEPEPAAFQQGGGSCFHFHVTRNMSALLADATKMLQRVRDRTEREWLLTFVFRVKALAEHLRTHPQSRNYDCLAAAPLQQQELYFVDDVKRDEEGTTDQSRLQQEPGGSPVAATAGMDTKTSNTGVQDIAAEHGAPDADAAALTERASSKSEEDLGQPEEVAGGGDAHDEDDPFHNVIVLSSPPDCDAKKKCDEMMKRHQISDRQDEDVLVQQLHSRQPSSSTEEDLVYQEYLKERIRKALLNEMGEEMKKLREVGGSEEDLIQIWKESEAKHGDSAEKQFETDFDYEENGAAIGDPSSNDRFSTSDPTVAPSLNEILNSRKSSTAQSHEPYDDSDVLVKQLFDVRFELPPSETTRSLDDQQEYLISSTQSPY